MFLGVFIMQTAIYYHYSGNPPFFITHNTLKGANIMDYTAKKRKMYKCYGMSPFTVHRFHQQIHTLSAKHFLCKSFVRQSILNSRACALQISMGYHTLVSCATVALGLSLYNWVQHVVHRKAQARGAHLWVMLRSPEGSPHSVL